MKYKLQVWPDFEQDEIHMKLFTNFNEMEHLLSYTVMKTKDKEVRKALIALGWTPPDKDDQI